MSLSVSPGPLFSELTTLKLGGKAVAEVRIGAESDLEKLPEALVREGGRPLVFGWGSNILAHDGDIPVTLIRVPDGGKAEVVRETPEFVTVRADAGMRLPRLLVWLAKRGLSGMEGLAGIPGTVGGAVAMNAGSFGNDISQVLTRVLVFSPCCGLRWVVRSDVRMGYRLFEPIVADEYFVVMGVELQLRIQSHDVVKAAMDSAMTKKKASQPVNAASAGCVFRNPEGDAAGRLLDEAGFRGRKLGGMAFSEVHANFLVNEGGGTAGQALELIEQARATVLDRFGIPLELEVKVVS